MNILIFAIFLINLNLLYGLKKIDVCLIETADKNAKECPISYPYMCNLKYCSKNRQSCKDQNVLESYIKAETNYKIRFRLKLMIGSIKPCFKNKHKTKREPKEICNQKCLLKQYDGLFCPCEK